MNFFYLKTHTHTNLYPRKPFLSYVYVITAKKKKSHLSLVSYTDFLTKTPYDKIREL